MNKKKHRESRGFQLNMKIQAVIFEYAIQHASHCTPRVHHGVLTHYLLILRKQLPQLAVSRKASSHMNIGCFFSILNYSHRINLFSHEMLSRRLERLILSGCQSSCGVLMLREGCQGDRPLKLHDAPTY